MSIKTTWFIWLIIALALAACSPEGGQSPQGGSGPVEVKISMTEFAFESPITEFQTGVTYRFVVTNNGAIPHEFMILPPMENASNMTMEELDEMSLVVIEEDDLPPGATQTVEFMFTEPASTGSLEFACHTPGHYDAGMKLPITVK